MDRTAGKARRHLHRRRSKSGSEVSTPAEAGRSLDCQLAISDGNWFVPTVVNRRSALDNRQSSDPRATARGTDLMAQLQLRLLQKHVPGPAADAGIFTAINLGPITKLVTVLIRAFRFFVFQRD